MFVYFFRIHITPRKGRKNTDFLLLISFYSKHVVLSTHPSFKECFKTQVLAKILMTNSSHIQPTQEPQIVSQLCSTVVDVLYYVVIVVVSLFMVSDSFLLPMLLSGLHDPGFEFRLLALPTVGTILSTSRGNIALNVIMNFTYLL